MQTDTLIHIVSVHSEGEVGNVITGGVAPPPGETLWAQRDFWPKIRSLESFFYTSPGGGVFTHFNLLVPPKDPRAAAAFLIMEPVHTPPMSGSNTICVATMCLETGIIPMQEGQFQFYLEVPAGLIHINATCQSGRVLTIEFTNVPSFVDKLDRLVEVEGLGT